MEWLTGPAHSIPRTTQTGRNSTPFLMGLAFVAQCGWEDGAPVRGLWRGGGRFFRTRSEDFSCLHGLSTARADAPARTIRLVNRYLGRAASEFARRTRFWHAACSVGTEGANVVR